MDRSNLDEIEWSGSPEEDSVSMTERAQDAWVDFVGAGGRWRTIVGPSAFALGAIGLLVYDHLHQKVPQIVFWLALALIVVVFVWLIKAGRRHSAALHGHSPLSDHVTGLHNRHCLEADIAAVLKSPGDRRVLLLFDLDGLQTYNDRFGYRAGDELLRRVAQRLQDAVTPLGGTAYRIDDNRLSLLVPAGDRELGEIVLGATASLHDEGKDLMLGRSYGEVAIPDEASDAVVAMQIAGQRLASHNQRQHRSARRQAHAVLMAVLGARRPELREHLRIVAYRAISLGRRLGLGREEIDDVALAAELQDIGLLAVPEAILEKRSVLTAEEAALIRDRSVAGEKIIGSAPGLAPVAGLVRASSENFDGSGFPDGIAGETIPMGARIIAVAVAFAALTAPRPYRPAGTIEEALAELRRCSGTQFDPQVVEALAADLTEEVQPLAASTA